MNIKTLLIVAAILTVGGTYSSDNIYIARGDFRGGGDEFRGGDDFGGRRDQDFGRGRDQNNMGREAAGMEFSHNRGEEQGEQNSFNAAEDAASSIPEYYPNENQMYYPSQNQNQMYFPNN